MVDTSKIMAVTTRESIAEDDAYFKTMLGLIQTQITERPKQMNTDSDVEEEASSTPQEPPVKERKQKNKKQKKRKKDHEEDAQFTEVKAKKSKGDNPSSKDTVVSPALVPGPADALLQTSIAEIEDKRARLRAKIAELQAKRKLTDSERLNKKKLTRQESKMKLKQKRKMDKLNKNVPIINGHGSGKGSKTVSSTASPSKPIYNSDGQLVFSKFDFTASGKKEKGEKSDLVGRDYKRLLEKIEKRNEKIKSVKSRDEEAGSKLEEKFRWQSVMHKAEGEKVKDNPELLKKALKRKEKIKDQRKKKWDDRTKTVKKYQDDRLKKRNDNIQKRKQSNKDKKIQKAKKKGRILPGF